MAVLPYRDEIVAAGIGVYYGDSAPTSGTFNAGDLLIVVPTSSATPTGIYPSLYRCTVASSANNGGTWAPVGNGDSYSSTVIAAAATIAPTSNVFHVSGTAHTVDTITIPTGLQAGASLTMIPDSTWSTTTSGNIKIASTAVVGKAMLMFYDGTLLYPSY